MPSRCNLSADRRSPELAGGPGETGQELDSRELDDVELEQQQLDAPAPAPERAAAEDTTEPVRGIGGPHDPGLPGRAPALGLRDPQSVEAGRLVLLGRERRPAVPAAQAARGGQAHRGRRSPGRPTGATNLAADQTGPRRIAVLAAGAVGAAADPRREPREDPLRGAARPRRGRPPRPGTPRVVPVAPRPPRVGRTANRLDGRRTPGGHPHPRLHPRLRPRLRAVGDRLVRQGRAELERSTR